MLNLFQEINEYIAWFHWAYRIQFDILSHYYSFQEYAPLC